MTVPLTQFLVAACVVAADRVTKASGAGGVPPGSARRLPFYRLTLTRFPTSGPLHSPLALLSLWTALLAAVVFSTHAGHLFQRPAAQIALSAAFAGAASNLFDRLRRGAVVDLLHLGWWPAFNLADVAITLAVGIAVCSI